MHVVLLKNTIINGERYAAGDIVNVSDEMAVKLEESEFAYCAEVSESDVKDLGEINDEDVNKETQDEDAFEETEDQKTSDETTEDEDTSEDDEFDEVPSLDKVDESVLDQALAQIPEVEKEAEEATEEEVSAESQEKPKKQVVKTLKRTPRKRKPIGASNVRL